jgi:hypothetical protein
MSLLKKSSLSLIITGALFVSFMVGLTLFQNAQKAIGSVVIGNEGMATTTGSTLSTTVCMPKLTERTVLNSVIVTLTSNAGIVIYDATTSNAFGYADITGLPASSTIAEFKTTTVGDYIFDVKARHGICVMSLSTVGVASTTIVTRP